MTKTLGMDLAVLSHSAPSEDQSIGVSGACLWLVEGAGAKEMGRALGQTARCHPATLWDWLRMAMDVPALSGGPCAGVCVRVGRDGFEASVFGEAALAIANESSPGEVRVWEDDRLGALLRNARLGFRGLLASGQGVGAALEMSQPAVERCEMLADCPGGWASLSVSGRGLAQACRGREAVPLSARIALASSALVRAVRSDETSISWDDVLSVSADRLLEEQGGGVEASVHSSGPCFLRAAMACREGTAAS